MRRLVGLIVLVVLGAVSVSFGASNVEEVSLKLFPLPEALPALPLAAILFMALFVGVIIGGIATWLGAGASRARAREAERKARAKELELAEMRRKFAEAAEEARNAAPAIGDDRATKGAALIGGPASDRAA